MGSSIAQFSKIPLPIPVTNGMNNTQLFQTMYVKPKNLAAKGGMLSNDFGIIPGLRKHKKVKSINRINRLGKRVE